jgi:putative addiction module CopG family antidote
MKTQALNIKLTAELRRYVKSQVRSGRYQTENEVVRDAIRQMQEREIEQFERLFGVYAGAPQGEPTLKDDQAIQAAINRHRDAKRTRRACLLSSSTRTRSSARSSGRGAPLDVA